MSPMLGENARACFVLISIRSWVVLSSSSWVMQADGIVETLTPVPQTDGTLIADIDDAGTIRHIVAFEFLRGQEPDEASGLAAWFHELGAVSARLHAHSRRGPRRRALSARPGISRRRWAAVRFGAIGAKGSASSRRDAQVLEEVAELLRRRLAAHGEDRDKFGLVHADLRLANLLIDGDRLSVIDFDDCGFSWYLYDFAAAISFLEHEPYIPELLDAWIAGYRSVAPLSDADAAMIPTFIMLRRMLLTAWIASHSETPMAQQMGEAYTRGTVALGRAFLAEHADAAARPGRRRHETRSHANPGAERLPRGAAGRACRGRGRSGRTAPEGVRRRLGAVLPRAAENGARRGRLSLCLRRAALSGFLQQRADRWPLPSEGRRSGLQAACRDQHPFPLSA